MDLKENFRSDNDGKIILNLPEHDRRLNSIICLKVFGIIFYIPIFIFLVSIIVIKPKISFLICFAIFCLVAYKYFSILNMLLRKSYDRIIIDENKRKIIHSRFILKESNEIFADFDDIQLLYTSYLTKEIQTKHNTSLEHYIQVCLVNNSNDIIEIMRLPYDDSFKSSAKKTTDELSEKLVNVLNCEFIHASEGKQIFFSKDKKTANFKGKITYFDEDEIMDNVAEQDLKEAIVSVLILIFFDMLLPAGICILCVFFTEKLESLALSCFLKK